MKNSIVNMGNNTPPALEKALSRIISRIKLEIPIDENTESLIKGNTEVPIEENTEVPIEENTEVPIEENTEVPIEENTEVPIEENTEVPIEENTEVPIEENTEVPIEENTEVPIEENTEVPIEENTEVPIEENTEVPIEEPSYAHLWTLCESCEALHFRQHLKLDMNICNQCDSHLKVNSSDRIDFLLDLNTFYSLHQGLTCVDPIEWDSDEALFQEKYWQSVQNEVANKECFSSGVEKAKDPERWDGNEERPPDSEDQCRYQHSDWDSADKYRHRRAWRSASGSYSPAKSTHKCGYHNFTWNSLKYKLKLLSGDPDFNPDTQTCKVFHEAFIKWYSRQNKEFHEQVRKWHSRRNSVTITEGVLEERRLVDSAVLFCFVQFLRNIWHEENPLLDRVFGRSRRESLCRNLNLLTFYFYYYDYSEYKSSEHKSEDSSEHDFSEHKPEDSSEYKSDDSSEYKSEDSSEYKSEDSSEYKSEDFSEYKSEDFSEYKSDDSSEHKPEDSSEHDFSEHKPEDSSEYKSEDSSEHKPEDSSEHDFSEHKPEDSSEYKSEDSSEYKSEDSSEYKSEDFSEYKSEDFSEYKSDDSSEHKPEDSSEHDFSEHKPEDSSEYKPNSTESGLWESTAQKSEKQDEDEKKKIEYLGLEKYKEEQEALENVDVEEDDPYQDRIFDYTKDTGLPEAIQTGKGQLNAIPLVFGAMEFWFMGGSMGSVVGERIARLVESASNAVLPLILVCASGGARMQEGSYSLMQMAKISGTLHFFRKEANKKIKLLYLALLASPTTGGVVASFGMLGDLIIGEPNATIAFAGKRVIEETLKVLVPEGSQEAEPLFEAGVLDKIVPRTLLKGVFTHLFEFHAFFPLNQNAMNNQVFT